MDMAQHLLKSGGQAFKNTVTPQYVSKLAGKLVDKASGGIGRLFSRGKGPRFRTRRGTSTRYVGRRLQRRRRR